MTTTTVLATSMQPWTPSAATHTAFTEFFPESPHKSHPTHVTYSCQNDFGKKINTLLFTTPRPRFSSYFFSNIQAIGQMEGFTVIPSEKRFEAYCVRDPKLSTAQGHMLEPTCATNLPQALERNILRHRHLKDHSATASTHPLLAGKYFGQVATGKLHRRTCDQLPTGIQRDSRLYFEGGNCFLTTKNNHKRGYVIGEDCLTTTHQSLRLDEWFKNPGSRFKPETQTLACINERLLFQKYKSDINKWLLNGEIPERIDEIAKELSSSMTDPDIQATLEEMKAMGLLTVVKLDSAAEKTKGRQIATQYLAQREFVKKYIFPQELECEAEDITFVPQAAYHLDVFMTPGPNGSMFVQDYALAMQTLLQIQKNSKELNLTQSDLEQLDNLIATTGQIGRELSPILNKVKENLRGGGFSIIPTPGAFFGADPHNPTKKTHIINFLNCLTGFSPTTKHFYYIAAGTKTEGVLGDVLMNAYGEFLQSQCSHLAVYFAGRNPADPTDFSEAVRDMNKLQLGPHCLSYELPFAPPSQPAQSHLVDVRSYKPSEQKGSD